NKKAQDKMKEYCHVGKNEGAKLLLGGQAPENGKGWYFEPTLFTDCTPEMRICQEEIFGPIVSMISAKNLEDAIAIANSVDYGLSSAIYTRSIGNALTAIKKLQAGITYVNRPPVGSESHLPFGGVKSSGSNRESGPEGTNEFTELKTVYIDYSRPQPILNTSQDMQKQKTTYGTP
ncbi:MAG: aldehyde dehydrogenase family protein, partial [Bacillota bacterium]